MLGIIAGVITLSVLGVLYWAYRILRNYPHDLEDQRGG